MTEKVDETNLDEAETYLKQRASAHSIAIEESMNRKLGYWMKPSGMVNPSRPTTTQSEYDIHGWGFKP